MKSSDFQNIFKTLQYDIDEEAREINLNLMMLNLQDMNGKNNNNNIDGNDDDPFSYISLLKSILRIKFIPSFHEGKQLIEFHDFQNLVILIHQLSIVSFEKKLWQSYSQYGTGQFYQQQNKSICIWPQQVITMVFNANYHHIFNVDDITHTLCVAFVKKVQNYLNLKEKNYQQNFDILLMKYHQKQIQVTEMIQSFIKKDDDLLAATNIHFQARIALVEYTYLDQLIQNQILQEESIGQYVSMNYYSIDNDL